MGNVSARSRKCGGCGGLGFGLVRNHVWSGKLCLLITMSRMGYITICPDGKCSCIQYPYTSHPAPYTPPAKHVYLIDKFSLYSLMMAKISGRNM